MTDNNGKRFALLIASSQYKDAEFKNLKAPANDIKALARVLSNRSIGNFDVKTLLNEPSHIVNQQIEDFFIDREKDDLLLLYFSGHGLKKIDEPFYLVTPNTNYKRFRSTGISANYINDLMQTSESRRQVLILDCCFSGAYSRGMVISKSKGNTNENTADDIKKYFEGFGRVVLTSSTSAQYSFEEEEIPGKEEVFSVFTNAMVRGLETGEADIDRDNCISVTDLYQYIYACVASKNQRPTINTFSKQGEIYIAKNPKPIDQDTIKLLNRKKELFALIIEKQNELKDLLTKKDSVESELRGLKGRLKFIEEEEERLSKLDSYTKWHYYIEFNTLASEKEEIKNMIEDDESKLSYLNWKIGDSKLELSDWNRIINRF